MHTIVLTESLTAHTDAFGFVESRHVLAPSVRFHFPRSGFRWMGDWYPFYEVFFDGNVYRVVALVHKRHIRCISSGLRKDGKIIKPGDTVPNTPRALIHEIASLSGKTTNAVNERAIDLLALASDREGSYGAKTPADIPERYRFKNVFLTHVNSDGTITSLFDPPTSDAHSWMIALKIIKTANDSVVDEFVSDSGNARLVGERLYARLSQIARHIRPQAISGRTRGTSRFSSELQRIGSQFAQQAEPVGLYHSRGDW